MIGFNQITWGASSILILVCAIRIYQSYLKSKDKILRNFFNFFALFGIASFLFFVARIIENLFSIKLAYITGLLLMFSALAYLARVSFSLIYPKLTNFVFWLTMFGNGLSFSSNLFYYLPSPGRATPMTLARETQNLVLAIWSYGALFILISCFGLVLISGILASIKSFRSKERGVRIKGFLFASALILFGGGGAFRGMVETGAIIPSLPNFIISLGFLFFLAATLYVIEKKLPASKPIPTLPIKW